MAEITEVRCPVGPRELLMKLRQEGLSPRMVDDNMLLECFCRFCSRMAKREDPTVRQVLHRFDVLGRLVESVVVRS